MGNVRKLLLKMMLFGLCRLTSETLHPAVVPVL